jgi:hypothetical protein
VINIAVIYSSGRGHKNIWQLVKILCCELNYAPVLTVL